MNACESCNQCADTGCTCPAKVTKAKPLGGGNVWFAEPEPKRGFWRGVYQYFFGV